MTTLAELLDADVAAALARLKLDLATAAPPPGSPVTAATCTECGQPWPARPAPAATFISPERTSHGPA